MAAAGRAHDLLLHIPDKSTPPATPQPAPVMDRYSGLRLDAYSFNTSQACKAATKRVTPHADKLNTIHSRRVAPKGLFEYMDQVCWNRIRPLFKKEAAASRLYPTLPFRSFRFFAAFPVRAQHP